MTLISKIDKIILIVNELNGPVKACEIMTDRKERLKTLVDEHTIELVVHASGLSEATIKQHLRVKNPIHLHIAEKAIAQAEYVFKQL